VAKCHGVSIHVELNVLLLLLLLLLLPAGLLMRTLT